MTQDELRAYLAARSMSQRALARLLGVHPVTIARWATGVYPIPRWAELAMARL